MQLNGLMDRFYVFSQWMVRCAFLNVLWIFFTLLGLIILGIMPASTAMFSIIHKWLRGDRDIPIFLTFWSEYRASFIPTNIFGIILFLIGSILYLDYSIILSIQGALYFILLIGLITISILFIILTLYIIPVYVHFQLRTLQYFKHALLLGIANFHYTILMILGVIILFYFCNFIPSLVPFFAFSLTGLLIMWLVNRAFTKVHKINSTNQNI
jgi:uncharacterized membrane protein YesL